ncbi:MAG TPA: hypothetical protein PK195_09405 [Ignavibacteriaceae bacterium]|nr:hypothetical protein [Ignavibacteriaceae bacterium]
MSYAEDVKEIYEIQKGKIFTWNDLVKEMNIKAYISKEEKTQPMKHNSLLKVIFIDGSKVDIDDPLGILNAFLVILAQQE